MDAGPLQHTGRRQQQSFRDCKLVMLILKPFSVSQENGDGSKSSSWWQNIGWTTTSGSVVVWAALLCWRWKKSWRLDEVKQDYNTSISRTRITRSPVKYLQQRNRMVPGMKHWIHAGTGFVGLVVRKLNMAFWWKQVRCIVRAYEKKSKTCSVVTVAELGVPWIRQNCTSTIRVRKCLALLEWDTSRTHAFSSQILLSTVLILSTIDHVGRASSDP